jgi:DNA-binding CsgD family transcriptional regulator
MTVIDGAHRVLAAKLRGQDHIAVEFFDGPEDECFVEAVKANVGRGKPLTLLERENAASRILHQHPDWSDRGIAKICGLSPRTIASLRRRASADCAQPRARVGIDGRVRRLDIGPARMNAAALLGDRPEASTREIARAAGISVATVRDVRSRLNRKQDPVPSGHRARRHVGSQLRQSDSHVVEDALPAGEPTTSDFFEWFAAHHVCSSECERFLNSIPSESLPEILREARSRSRAWIDFCEGVEARLRAVTDGCEAIRQE